MKLTEKKIERLTVEGKRKDRLVFDDAQRGLAVRVTASGGRTYLAQFTQHGSKHRVPLGSCSALSLAKAREAASAVMGDVAKGRNPAAERKEATAAAKAKAARDRHTLVTLIEDWEKLHLVNRRPRYAAEAVRALRYAFARYLERPADELDRATVVRALDALRTKKAKEKVNATDAESASRTGSGIARGTAAYGRAAYSWAMKRGTVANNPFANLPVASAVTKRERVLNDEEVTAVWRAAGKVASPYGSIVRLLMLTGQRRDEVAGMTWDEIADDLATWKIPGNRTKNGAPHIVPLSEPARELLRGLLPDDPDECDQAFKERSKQSTLVLPGERTTPFSGWSKSKKNLDLAAELRGWRLHDLRRTLATGLQRLGVRLEVTESVLNHVSGTRAGIVGVYQRHDWAAEKRAALDAWAAHVIAVSEGRGSKTNVIRAAFG